MSKSELDKQMLIAAGLLILGWSVVAAVVVGAIWIAWELYG